MKREGVPSILFIVKKLERSDSELRHSAVRIRYSAVRFFLLPKFLFRSARPFFRPEALLTSVSF